MTELTEDEKLLKECHDKFAQVMHKLYPKIEWFLATRISDVTLYSGNGCAVCAVDAAHE